MYAEYSNIGYNIIGLSRQMAAIIRDSLQRDLQDCTHLTAAEREGIARIVKELETQLKKHIFK